MPPRALKLALTPPLTLVEVITKPLIRVVTCNRPDVLWFLDLVLPMAPRAFKLAEIYLY